MRNGKRRHGLRGHADWVYRPYKFELSDDDAEGPPLYNPEEFLSGTYYNPISVLNGVEGSTAQVLYDSKDYVSSKLAADYKAADGALHRYVVPQQARPDSIGRGALIHGVELGIYTFLQASSWTATQLLSLGWRIIIARQLEDGRASVDPNYSMWQPVSDNELQQPSVYANGRLNCAEGRIFRTQQASAPLHVMYHRPFVPFKRRLDAHEALYLYIELHPNSVPLVGPAGFVNFWCRTLVTDYARA